MRLNKRIVWQISVILLTVVLFAAFNMSLYMLLTRRLSNNFSDTSQAKMIDVFVNIIREAERNGITIKIIFETHSEAMVNRIGTLISEKKILAEKVNVLIFDKNNEQTYIESKQFNTDGLLMGWPIGFFATEEG